MSQKTIKIATNIAAIILAIAVVWFALKITVFSSLPESEAKLWVRFSERVLIGFAILLAIGILGEWPESESWKKSVLYRAAKAAVLIGVLGELLGDAGIFEADKRLQDLEATAINNAADSATTALNNAKDAENRAREAETIANNLLSENMELRAKIADRDIPGEDRELIRRRLKGNQQPVTVVVPNDREPRVYGARIANALKAADFDVSIDDWRYEIPPDTGVVFCEIRNGDRNMYEVLHLARVATRFISLADHRPDFCDKPGVEAPIEQLIAQLSLGILTPEKVGRLVPRGSLAKKRGPRIFVGQKEK
jgi:hypothetical protein